MKEGEVMEGRKGGRKGGRKSLHSKSVLALSFEGLLEGYTILTSFKELLVPNPSL